jgi:hypothetical protein
MKLGMRPLVQRLGSLEDGLQIRTLRALDRLVIAIERINLETAVCLLA